jgi:hypothetical protein
MGIHIPIPQEILDRLDATDATMAEMLAEVQETNRHLTTIADLLRDLNRSAQAVV